MSTISEFMSTDHQRCDTLFAKAEAAAPAAAAQAFAAFVEAMQHHLAMEEQVLFPAFEQATGNSMGPTRIMRMEHEQMRELFGQMGEALAANDGSTFAGLAETLLILMQQHNMKEEQILYPMSDRALGDTAGLIERMQAIA
ncbi:MAG TPA: hemerythrin domain-containing protein [Gallionellaceae bacterium]|nr:hemerythrin domain-containing protein [Gallionellaceae bacterium]